MTAFFVPGRNRTSREAEETYTRIREAAHAHTGHSPQPLRIFRLWFRHVGTDVEAEVGKPDPVGGNTVLAILDLGRHSPYLLHCRSEKGPPVEVLVSKPVYSVTEFGAN